MTAAALARLLFGAACFTLPFIGVGVIRLLTGRDAGAGLQPSWVLLALATAAVLPARPWRGYTAPPAVRRLALAGGAALALSGLGLLLVPAPEPLAATSLRFGKQVIQLAIMAAFLVWPAVWVRGTDRWRLVARVIVFGALLQAAYGLLQWAHWYHPSALLPALERVFTSNPAILSGSEQLHLGDSFRDVPRLRGTACEPLYLGNFLLLVLPLLALTGWRRAARTAAGLALGLLLVLTWSRGAWLAGGAAAALAWLLRRRGPRGLPGPGRRRLLIAGMLVGAAAVLVLVMLGPERLGLPLQRLAQSFSSRDWSNLTRAYSMQAAWRAFLLSPVVGVGWGQFGWHFPVLVDAAGLQSQFQWPVVNNFPLQILCETGILGFGVFAAATGALAGAVARALGEAGPQARRQRVRLAAVATAGVWLQLLTFSQYNLPHIWIAPGLLLAALADRTEDPFPEAGA